MAVWLERDIDVLDGIMLIQPHTTPLLPSPSTTDATDFPPPRAPRCPSPPSHLVTTPDTPFVIRPWIDPNVTLLGPHLFVSLLEMGTERCPRKDLPEHAGGGTGNDNAQHGPGSCRIEPLDECC